MGDHPPAAVPRDIPLASRLVGGRYRIEALIGRGAMGTVYRARHVLTDNLVALKCILPDHAQHDLFVARFRREVSVSARVTHDGIVKVHDAGQEDDGTLYLAMELLEGATLRDFSRKPKFTSDVGIRIVRAMLEPLAAVHAAGIVHRDIKPANVFVQQRLDGSEQVKLLDFGIARNQQLQSSTRADIGLGTPLYMSPEQATNARAVTAASDVWSVGVILYWLLAGHLPFRADTPFNTLTLVCSTPHPPLTSSGKPARKQLIELVDQTLHKDARNRPQNAGRLLDSLDRILGRPQVAENLSSTIVADLKRPRVKSLPATAALSISSVLDDPTPLASSKPLDDPTPLDDPMPLDDPTPLDDLMPLDDLTPLEALTIAQGAPSTENRQRRTIFWVAMSLVLTTALIATGLLTVHSQRRARSPQGRMPPARSGPSTVQRPPANYPNAKQPAAMPTEVPPPPPTPSLVPKPAATPPTPKPILTVPAADRVKAARPVLAPRSTSTDKKSHRPTRRRTIIRALEQRQALPPKGINATSPAQSPAGNAPSEGSATSTANVARPPARSPTRNEDAAATPSVGTKTRPTANSVPRREARHTSTAPGLTNTKVEPPANRQTPPKETPSLKKTRKKKEQRFFTF